MPRSPRYESMRRPRLFVSMFRALMVPLLTLCLWLITTPTVQAAEISVTGACGLVDAITAANTDTATGGCSAGEAGSDTLVLEVNATYTLTDYNNSVGGQGHNGLPAIQSTIVISGHGATIERDPAIVCQGVFVPNFRLFYIDSTGDLTLQDTTVRYGCLLDNRFNRMGGGIFNDGGRLTLQHSNVLSNTARSGAGGIYSGGSGAAITVSAQSKVAGNLSNLAGGGITNEGGRLVIQGSEVSGNQADNSGGGIYNLEGTLTIQDSKLFSNTAHSLGGGVAISNGTLLIQHSDVLSNVVGGDDILSYQGGGIYVGSAVVTITQQSRIGANQADNRGGGISISDGTLTLQNSSVLSNSAQFGGGVYANGNNTINITVKVESSDIVANYASADGGGIIVNYSSLMVTQSRLLRNRVGSGSAGALFQYLGSATVESSCIVLNDNTAVVVDGDGSPLQATGNWWGTDSGPSGAGAGLWRFGQRECRF